MKKEIKWFIFAGIFFFAGCDIIKEEDRLIPVTNENAGGKKVLLLEFTDQSCTNCVNATIEIGKLSERFSDTLIAVSIHANPLPYPLGTGEGNEYERHFQAEDHPAGIIDGGGGGKFFSHDPQVWGGFILEKLKVNPAVTIELNVVFDETHTEASIHVQLTGNKALANVRLLVWIIENNIRQWQLMPDGTRNENYIHNHIFRSSINGTWGELFSIGINEQKAFNYSFTPASGWKPEDLAIVGFVYDPETDETFNSQEISLIKKTE